MPRRPPSGPPCAPRWPTSLPGDLVLVACSGGADSLALAAAPGLRGDLGRRGGPARSSSTTPCSPARRRSPREAARPAARPRPRPGRRGDRRGRPPPVTASRPPPATARYAALDAAADRHGAVAVLLGHTLDDQAEQVLLGLTRGAGRPVAGRDAGRPRPLPPPPPRGDPGAVPRVAARPQGLDLVGRPDERGPRLHPGARPPGPGRPRARPRAGGGRGPGAHGIPAA